MEYFEAKAKIQDGEKNLNSLGVLSQCLVTVKFYEKCVSSQMATLILMVNIGLRRRGSEICHDETWHCILSEKHSPFCSSVWGRPETCVLISSVFKSRL